MKLVGYVDGKFQGEHCGHTVLAFTLATSLIVGARGDDRVYNAVFYIPLAMDRDSGRLFAFRANEGTEVSIEYESDGRKVELVPNLRSGHQFLKVTRVEFPEDTAEPRRDERDMVRVRSASSGRQTFRD